MEFITYLYIVLLMLFIYHINSIQFKTRKLPPGPIMSPFGLGIIPSCFHYSPALITVLRPWVVLHKMKNRFGDLFSMEAGGYYAVVVSSYELLQEIANLDEYSIKYSDKIWTQPRTFNKELGLLSVGKPEIWVEMRKFTQRTLREFGFGKRHTMQSAIEAETNTLVTQFQQTIETNKGIMKIRTTFLLSIVNVLWCMVAGKRYEHDDPNLITLMESNYNMTKAGMFANPYQFAFKWLEKIFPEMFNQKFLSSVYDKCHKFTKSLVDERKDAHKTHPENYIDVFLKKIEENKSNEKSVYTDEQLQVILEDLLQAGSTTVNGTLNYAVLYLILNPEVQKKCQDEIDVIVSKHLTPTMEDIEKMPYFQAFVLETHRLANVVPNPIPRTVPKDWNIRGYTIPKGAVILTNHYSVHMDEKYWQDPKAFRPERFINQNGEFVRDKRVVHYGFGKRICIGITLSDSIIAIFLASLLQKFSFSVVPGEKAPSTASEIGLVLSPYEFSMKVSSR